MRAGLVFLLALMYCVSNAQSNSILFKVGVGTYSMKTQKKFQDEFQQQSGLPLEIVHRFPPYFSFGAELGFKFTDRSVAGVWYDFTSTGGRLHYKDYSATARMDQVLKCSHVGMFFQTRINRSEEWRLFATGHASAVLSKALFSTELSIGNDSDVNQYSFKSTNIGLRPGIMLQRNVKKIILQGNIGYEIQTNDVLHTKDGAKLHTYSGERVSAEWDGLRATVGIGFSLARSPSDDL
jgi:hypothetical protein